MESRPLVGLPGCRGGLQYLGPKLNNIKNVQHPRAPSNFKFKTRGSPGHGTQLEKEGEHRAPEV